VLASPVNLVRMTGAGDGGSMHAGKNRRTRRSALLMGALVTAVFAMTACVEKTEIVQPSSTTSAPAQAGTKADGPTVVSQFPGVETSFGKLPAEARAAGTDNPIIVGMINQENTPLGSFPELRLAAAAAVKWINAELGGVGGRPIQFEPCVTTFSVEKSQACAQELVQKGAVAVTGGIDVSSKGSIPILEQNQVPLIGGVPVNDEEMQSPISFQFSGGSPGAMAAFADYAAKTQKAKKVVVIYGDYAPIHDAAVNYGSAVLRRLGVDDVTEIAYPVLSTDFLPTMTKAKQLEPDAIFLAAADTACAPAMKTAYDLGITAKMYLVGACAAPAIAEQIGEAAVAGRIFNIEGPLTESGPPEAAIYGAALAKYGPPELPIASAGTVSFRNIMNLYALMTELGPDNISRPSLLAQARSAVNHPSFNGHAYTCDGKQVPNLPALCAPQEILVEHKDGGLSQLSDWIDIPALLQG
jgi:branched-chain amino acid transport system substrate-binding protein